MSTSTKEIIALIGGVSAAAKFFGVTPSTMSEWGKANKMYEGRLIEHAARLEALTDGRFNRRDQWPDTFASIWPELAGDDAILG